MKIESVQERSILIFKTIFISIISISQKRDNIENVANFAFPLTYISCQLQPLSRGPPPIR